MYIHVHGLLYNVVYEDCCHIFTKQRSDSDDFEAISEKVLSFTTLDSEQCFNVSITNDSNNECCEDEMFKCVVATEEGSRVIAVEPFAYVYIQDQDDCGKSTI